MRSKTLVLLIVCLVGSLTAQSLAAVRGKPQGRPEPIARMMANGTSVWFDPVVELAGLTLRYAGPDAVVMENVFTANETAHITISPEMVDGVYRYELRLIPLGGSRQRSELEAGGMEYQAEPPIQTGSFLVRNGAVVQEKGGILRDNPMLDVVHADDVIVQGSLGVGLSSVVDQSFGFSTILLKEDNTRITFDDVSVAAGYPANDWQLTANDSAVGGVSYFAIEDLTGAKVPFKVLAGAPSNSLFVDSTGRVGLRTSTPVLDLHVHTSNTPAFRLEQDNSGGFTAQTWDIAGNEANFFIRDVTGGSRLPFRIRPGAPTSSIDIAASGNVGIGTASPKRLLHIAGPNAVFRMDRSMDSASFMLVRTTDAGVVLKSFVVGTTAIGSNNGEFIIQDMGTATAGAGVRRMTINNAGNASFTGSVTAAGYLVGSSQALKSNIRTFENALDTVNRLRGVRFDWKESGQAGLGLIAEEVDQVLPEIVQHEGGSARAVGYSNLVAVLIEAVKEQQRTIAQQQKTNDEQRVELDNLKAKVERLEALLVAGSR